MSTTVLLTVASGAEHPLIDIDYSVVIQLVIFLVTCFVATTMLFKPYLRMREERHAGMEGAREDAVKMSAEADSRLQDYEQKLAAARSRAQDERHKIRSEAAAHLAEVTDSARAEADKATKAARAKVNSETEKARTELLPKAEVLGQQIAARLLGREVS
ncbi:MAG: ATP synthase F0 subunit B [Deltaproteobacteria bacterium]|nr:ATP synthase F0 subunit B [Deltaproteobacteria bacterium]